MWNAGRAGRLGLAIVTVALAGGCPSTAPGDPDAPPGAGGLEVAWHTAADVPGPAGATLRVDELHLALSSVRAIGDAAPGDPRTAHGALELEWGDRRPDPLVFDRAPAGLYSQVELGVGGSAEAFELHGAVFLSDAWMPLEVEDEASLGIVLPTALALQPGARGTITVTLDVAAALAAVDFAQVPVVLGVVHLTRDDPQIGALRAALAAAFTADPAVIE